MAKSETELTVFIIENVKELSINSGLSIDASEKIAIELVDRLKSSWGGSIIYVAISENNFLRNKKICADFNGKNQSELGRKYKLSLVSIYKILKNTPKE